MRHIRKIDQIFQAIPTLEGAGVHLKRVFGHAEVPTFDPFLLLDDPLSSLDSTTALKIIDAIKDTSGGRCGILISNRISSIEHTDLILVMDKGKIIARGSHPELIETCELYKRIYLRQQLEK